MRLHSSNPNLSTLDFGEEKNYSDGSETSSEFSKMQEDLCHIAHKGELVTRVYLSLGCPHTGWLFLLHEDLGHLIFTYLLGSTDCIGKRFLFHF